MKGTWNAYGPQRTIVPMWAPQRDWRGMGRSLRPLVRRRLRGGRLFGLWAVKGQDERIPLLMIDSRAGCSLSID